MNRTQTFSLFLGAVLFILAGIFLESLRYTYDRTLWPAIGDMILILFLVALITAGLFWIFYESWRLWPILISTIAGFVLGISGYFLFMSFAPEYTATTFIEVLPPIEKNLTMTASVQVDRDILHRQCVAMAKLITQQSMFDKLLRVEAVRSTEWFQSFNGNMVDAIDDLKANLIADAQSDSDYIAISMTCRSPKESALIVNTAIDLFIKDQQTSIGSDFLSHLKELHEQQSTLENELKFAVSSLDELRASSARENITDLDEHTFRDPISTRQDNLQSENDKLIGDIKQAESDLGNLERQAADPNNVQVTLEVENYLRTDPVMITLSQQLTLKELELAQNSAGPSSSRPADTQTQRMIKIINEKIQARKAFVRDSIRLANFNNARDRLAGLKFRLQEVQQMLAEAVAKKKDYNQLRAQYDSLLAIKNERLKRLDELKLLIEKINIMRTDPESSKVAAVGLALDPLEPSFPKLGIFLPGGAALGFIIGAAISLCIGKTKEQNIAMDSVKPS